MLLATRTRQESTSQTEFPVALFGVIRSMEKPYWPTPAVVFSRRKTLQADTIHVINITVRTRSRMLA